LTGNHGISALRELTETTASIGGREVRDNFRATIFALDEVAALRHLEEIGTASGFLRGHGVMLMLFWQSVSQLFRHYGREESIRETIDVHIFGRPKTHEAAKVISDALGQFSTLVTKRNVSGKRMTVGPRDHLAENADITTRSLLTPSEVMRFPRERAIIFSRGLRINALKFSYFLHPWLVSRANLGQVGASSVMSARPLYIERLEKSLGPGPVALLQTPPPEPPPEEGEGKSEEPPARTPRRVSIPATEDPKSAYKQAVVR
jgi:type IV secretory pathway TraG/TraD family ATPase VirD4